MQLSNNEYFSALPFAISLSSEPVNSRGLLLKIGVLRININPLDKTSPVNLHFDSSKLIVT